MKGIERRAITGPQWQRPVGWTIPCLASDRGNAAALLGCSACCRQPRCDQSLRAVLPPALPPEVQPSGPPCPAPPSHWPWRKGTRAREEHRSPAFSSGEGQARKTALARPDLKFSRPGRLVRHHRHIGLGEKEPVLVKSIGHQRFHPAKVKLGKRRWLAPI